MTEKKWIPLHRKEPTISFSKNKVLVNNIRDFTHKSSTPRGKYITKVYSLDKLNAVWFAIDPLKPGTSFAHTFFSFQFGNDFLVISVEARRKKVSQRPGLFGFLPLFKLYYCATTEKDMFTLRCNRPDNIRLLLYKLNLKNKEALKLLIQIKNRMDYVHKNKIIFNSVYRNCTTELFKCFDKTMPGRLGLHWRRYLTSHVDKHLIRRKLITFTKNNIDMRSLHDVKKRVLTYKRGDFSAWIRKGL